MNLRKRIEILEGYDLQVLRFTNEQVNHNLEGVCQTVEEYLTSNKS
ncbi:MAG: DUF559 domain-containing protein [Cyanobacteria bacterium P01_G01_bin.19]